MSNIVKASASLVLSQYLNRVGHGDGNKFVSIDMSNILQMTYTDQILKVCVTGGISDGTSDICTDDFDVMCMCDGIILIENCDDIIPKRDQLIATIERTVHRPGYVLLKVTPSNTQVFSSVGLKNICVPVSGKGLYISSTNIIQEFIPVFEIAYRSGPAISTFSSQSEMHHILEHKDCVISMYCSKWPDEAKAWPDRVRQCCWPPGEMVQAIVSSGCHIVPKGSQGGVFSDIEWCISFAMHEKCMIRSFSSVQYHHYILLKRILKHKFLEKYPDIMTSYVAKTICFWQMELNKREMWQMKFLADRIIKSVLFLRDCVSSNYVPHYFIPENNIIHGKVNFKIRDELSSDLSNFSRIFIDLCDRPKALTQFLFGNNEMNDTLLKMKLTAYYDLITLAFSPSESSGTDMSMELLCPRVETIHGSVISTFNLLREEQCFNVVHKTLLKYIRESESEGNDYESKLQLIVLLNTSKNGGFSRKVRIAEIYFMLGQPDKCIDIITEALTMDTATALKGENDIKYRASDELVGIIKTRSIMSLSQFLASYILSPITLSEEHMCLWNRILQQDIFETIKYKPIKTDALPYVCFLLALAFLFSNRTKMAEEAVHTLICLIMEEPTKLDYKEVAICLLHYVVNLTSQERHVA
ncbi:hypothetical protein ACJMK2_000900 [Sinanodonta woodiana]|uniref:Uncharacterized protein n=1 Tax=Sinanodonta woodiana TaxID=1069815 RepID=A0ABD3XQM9_SINWO